MFITVCLRAIKAIFLKRANLVMAVHVGERVVIAYMKDTANDYIPLSVKLTLDFQCIFPMQKAKLVINDKAVYKNIGILANHIASGSKQEATDQTLSVHI